MRPISRSSGSSGGAMDETVIQTLRTEKSQTMKQKLKVYILGAGCSVCGGYPLASAVSSRLLEFAKSHLSGTESVKLREAVERTCARLENTGVQTIDQLAEQVPPEKFQTMRDAKLAMSLLFLALEDAGVNRALPNYIRFFDEIFPQCQDADLDDMLNKSRCRVVTYNYDRLFERTFLRWAKLRRCSGEFIEETEDKVAKKYLNMGIGNTKKIEFHKDRFSVLKLHGGIGQFCRDNDRGFKNIYRPKLETGIPEFRDENYHKPYGHTTDIPAMIFPKDKSLESYGDLGRSFENYMREVHKQAKEFCSLAGEIQIIGYAIQDIDFASFRDMLAATSAQCRIIVRNRVGDKLRLVRILEKLRSDLKAEWQIDYLEEDFFGIPLHS
jgi:hypothetical protein